MPAMMRKDEYYCLTGADFERIYLAATRLNSMSGQQLAGKGDEVRDLAETIHVIIDGAEGPVDARLGADLQQAATHADLHEKLDLLEEIECDIAIAKRLRTSIDVTALEDTVAQLRREIRAAL